MHLSVSGICAFLAMATTLSSTVTPTTGYGGTLVNTCVQILDVAYVSLEGQFAIDHYSAICHDYSSLELVLDAVEQPGLACLNGTRESIQAGLGRLRSSGCWSGSLSQSGYVLPAVVMNQVSRSYSPIEMGELQGTQGPYYHPSLFDSTYVFGFRTDFPSPFYGMAACPLPYCVARIPR